MKEQHKIN